MRNLSLCASGVSEMWYEGGGITPPVNNMWCLFGVSYRVIAAM
jgi:hypothetical protein